MAAQRPPRVVNRLPQFITQAEAKGARALTAALIRGGSEVAPLIPIDTSNLINSQYREVTKEGTRIIGRLGFTAEYALAVHEASGKLKGQPRPKRNGRPNGVFWGPHDGRPRFLPLAFERARGDITAILRGALKV